MTKPEPPDATTREGAETLARKLDRYWHAQGHTQVSHWVVPQLRAAGNKPRRGQPIWVVRSNLVGGMPPRSLA